MKTINTHESIQKLRTKFICACVRRREEWMARARATAFPDLKKDAVRYARDNNRQLVRELARV